MTNDSRPGNVRYAHEILAWEYDYRNHAIAPGELEWYLTYVNEAGGALLELACGSGRLLIPIAKSGHEIDGVDNSTAMLMRLEERLGQLNAETKRRVRTYCADMAEFVPDRTYGMVFIESLARRPPA